jgi:starch synthase
MVASEAAPFAKTGGLADVLGSLPPALARLGEEVAVVIPRYRGVPAGSSVLGIQIRVGPQAFPAGIQETIRQGVRYLFVDCPALYDRDGIYGEAGVDYPDNHLRFAALNQAAIAVARILFRPEVFHAHDWQAGLLPVYLRENLALDPTFSGTRCVFTIHNLGYQGSFPESALGEIGLSRAVFHPEGVEFYGLVNFLKAGIIWADAVNTVSPTYAREIQTPEFGFRMDGLLRARSYKLSGILNGVDYDEWNPETDVRLPAHYSAAELSGKRICKAELLGEMDLPIDLERPLLGVVSRFAEQKGMDLVLEAASADDSPLAKASLVVLGSGDGGLESGFQDLARANPRRVAVRMGYNENLSHLIEAGSDMFLMPSRYEPCGLNQIYSLRYGTVPIVRATGGLQDTVDAQTGFKFTGLAASDLGSAAGVALEAFQDRAAWVEKMRRGMRKDFSWDASAREYQKLYG